MNYYADGSSTIGVKSAHCVTDENGVILIFKETFASSLMNVREFTNNEEEYRGVIAALKLASRGDTVYTDSQLVYHQIRGDWKINKVHLIPFCREASELRHNKGVEVAWIGREYNLAGLVFDAMKRKRK